LPGKGKKGREWGEIEAVGRWFRRAFLQNSLLEKSYLSDLFADTYDEIFGAEILVIWNKNNYYIIF
jgi:hypothetical protein